MKKVFLALSLMLFVGSLSSTAFAASNDDKTEIKKDEKKKRKGKKAKKGACCAGKTSCGEKKTGTTEVK
ncbi:MAG: hypothetical protein V4622_05255 [Bacteroidota bacterium]